MKLIKTLLKITGALLALVIIAVIGLYVATSGDYPVAATVTDDPTLPAEDVNGVRLHLRTVGPEDAPVIIVLHGGPGNDFRSLLGLDALADTHRLVFYDQRGAGLSERVTIGQLTLDEYLAELDAIVEQYSNEQAILIGHSWGAILASAYMGEYPEKVSHAVLIEPGFLNATEEREWREAGNAFLSGPAFYWTATLTGFRAQRVDGPDAHAADDFLIGHMVHTFADHDDNPYHCAGESYDAPNWRFGALANQASALMADTDLARVQAGTNFSGPVLFMAGSCDSWIGPELQKKHAAQFVNATVAVIDNAGHELVWERPEETLGAIRAFLRD